MTLRRLAIALLIAVAVMGHSAKPTLVTDTTIELGD